MKKIPKKKEKNHNPMVEGIIKITEIVMTLRRPNRLKLFNIIYENRGITISELSRKSGLSYTNTFNHVKKLEAADIIKVNRGSTEAYNVSRIYFNEDNRQYIEAALEMNH